MRKAAVRKAAVIDVKEINPELLAFLGTQEAAVLTQAQIALKFDVPRKEVIRAKEHLASIPADSNGDVSPSDVAPGSDPGTIERVSLSGMNLDAGTRVRKLDPDAVKRYSDRMREDGGVHAFPPLEVWEVGGSRPVLVSGFHRFAASRVAFGDEFEWPVIRKQGTIQQAVLSAMKDNRRHGLRLSPEDRVGIIRRILESPEWGTKWGNSKIAKEIGETDRDLIARVRAEIFRERGEQDPGVRYVERGGTTYEQKVPRRKDDDSRGDDAAEDDSMGIGTDPTSVDQNGAGGEEDSEITARIDRAYLEAAPVLAHVHPSVLPRAEAMVLGFRDLASILISMKRWCTAHAPQAGGVPDPLHVLMENVAYMAVPLPAGEQSGWVNCPKCRDSDNKSTGEIGDVICDRCNGTGIKIPRLPK